MRDPLLNALRDAPVRAEYSLPEHQPHRSESFHKAAEAFLTLFDPTVLVSTASVWGNTSWVPVGGDLRVTDQLNRSIVGYRFIKKQHHLNVDVYVSVSVCNDDVAGQRWQTRSASKLLRLSDQPALAMALIDLSEAYLTGVPTRTNGRTRWAQQISKLARALIHHTDGWVLYLTPRGLHLEEANGTFLGHIDLN